MHPVRFNTYFMNCPKIKRDLNNTFNLLNIPTPPVGIIGIYFILLEIYLLALLGHVSLCNGKPLKKDKRLISMWYTFEKDLIID